MENQSSCACGEAPKFVFSCSGGSDVGEIADRSARKLSAGGAGKMYCLAGVGGHVDGIMRNTESAGKILAIDGCPVDCAKKILEHAGITGFAHIRITDLGMEKGKSPATDERISVVAEQGKALLAC